MKTRYISIDTNEQNIEAKIGRGESIATPYGMIPPLRHLGGAIHLISRDKEA